MDFDAAEPGEPGLDARLVDAHFRDPGQDRLRRRAWLEAAREVAFEECLPVRPLRARPGKRLAPGWWWSATTGRLVHYGSAAARLHVMLLDRDPRVRAISARPVELRWSRDGRDRAHICDLMVRLTGGAAVLADCTTRPALSRRQRSTAQAVGHACRAAGWQYWVLGPVDPVYQRNVTSLAGYRHRRYRGTQDLACAVRDAFAADKPLADGVAEIGDPMRVLPAVFHALWCGELTADLGVPMHEQMLLRSRDLL
jgi:hypothetical protein